MVFVTANYVKITEISVQDHVDRLPERYEFENLAANFLFDTGIDLKALAVNFLMGCVDKAFSTQRL